jgi:hypothetical protein
MNTTIIFMNTINYECLGPDLRNVSHFCNTTQISRVRAALSWDIPPPEPPKTAARGNWLQVHVQIPPYVHPPNLTATIVTIGGVLIQQIDTQLTGLTTSDAAFYNWPIHLPVDPDGLGRPCPFGGAIFITGPPIGTPGQPPSGTCDVAPSQYQYRIVYRLFGSTVEPNPILNPITPIQAYGSGSQPYYHLNSQGYFYYFSLLCNFGSVLGWWQPSTIGLYQIRLEIATQTSSGGYITEGYTDWYNIQVNFPYPINPDGPRGTLIPTNEPVCGTFPAGTNLTGTMTAQDLKYLASYSVSVINSDIPIVIDGGSKPNPGYTPIDTPATWSWNSATAQPCGYVAQLTVCDLTIYNSVPYPTYCVGVPPGGLGFCVGPALGIGM